MAPRTGTSRWWAWCLTSPEAVYFRILKQRSAEAARLILDRYGGVVMADGYGAYDALARGRPTFVLALPGPTSQIQLSELNV
jgi:hypothetical protein